MSVDILTTTLTPQNIAKVADAFHQRHEELFTYSERDNMVEVIDLETAVRGLVERPQLPVLARGQSSLNVPGVENVRPSLRKLVAL